MPAIALIIWTGFSVLILLTEDAKGQAEKVAIIFTFGAPKSSAGNRRF